MQDSSDVDQPPDFAAGQLWRCAGRSAEESPLLLINRVDPHPRGGEIFQVSIAGVRVRKPAEASGITTSLPHVPVIRQTFERSQAEFVRLQAPDPAYLSGHAQWKREFDTGNAGSFGVSVAEVLDFVERGLAAKR
ncbi:hypothetical protein ACFPOA_00655 [Lysobacter niabensis]|uniref:hypothetical protein n=1 Tax=Agrilutibacter niabensis TaxID=380628 RepID=UPI00360968DC